MSMVIFFFFLYLKGYILHINMFVCTHRHEQADPGLSLAPTKPKQTKPPLPCRPADRATEGAFCPASTDESIGNGGRADRQWPFYVIRRTLTHIHTHISWLTQRGIVCHNTFLLNNHISFCDSLNQVPPQPKKKTRSPSRNCFSFPWGQLRKAGKLQLNSCIFVQ